MRDLKEIVRQKWQRPSHRQMAESVGAGRRRCGAKAAGVTSWAAMEELAPSELKPRLYPSVAAAERPTPHCD